MRLKFDDCETIAEQHAVGTLIVIENIINSNRPNELKIDLIKEIIQKWDSPPQFSTGAISPGKDLKNEE